MEISIKYIHIVKKSFKQFKKYMWQTFIMEKSVKQFQKYNKIPIFEKVTNFW